MSINDELLEEVGGLLAAASADQSGDPGDGGDRRPPFDTAGSSELQERLMAPVSAALGSSGVDRRTSDRIMEMLFAAVRALRYRDIVSIAQSVSAGGESHLSEATS